MELHILPGQLNLGIELEIKAPHQRRGSELSDDCGNRRAGDAHGGGAKPAMNQDGIQDDVDDGTQALGDHGMDRPACGLEQPLAQHGHKHAQSQQAADFGINDAALHGFRHGGLHLIVGSDAERAEEHEQDGADHHQGDAVARGKVGGLLILFAQALAEQGVDAHADTHGEADLHILNGEGQGQGSHRALGNLRDIDAVHHVIKGLHQHGGNHGKAHIQQKLPLRHDAHFVFS